jgi:hypothetical protein
MNVGTQLVANEYIVVLNDDADVGEVPGRRGARWQVVAQWATALRVYAVRPGLIVGSAPARTSSVEQVQVYSADRITRGAGPHDRGPPLDTVPTTTDGARPRIHHRHRNPDHA